MEIKEFWECSKKWNDVSIKWKQDEIRQLEKKNALADKNLSGMEKAEKSEGLNG